MAASGAVYPAPLPRGDDDAPGRANRSARGQAYPDKEASMFTFNKCLYYFMGQTNEHSHRTDRHLLISPLYLPSNNIAKKKHISGLTPSQTPRKFVQLCIKSVSRILHKGNALCKAISDFYTYNAQRTTHHAPRRFVELNYMAVTVFFLLFFFLWYGAFVCYNTWCLIQRRIPPKKVPSAASGYSKVPVSRM